MQKNNQTKQKQKIPSWTLRIVYGVLMGISDIIPGYSGGTTLTLLNFYDPLIENGKGIFKPQKDKKWHQHLVWILPFLIFWITSFIGFSFAVKAIKDANFEDMLIVMFASFAFCCIPIFWIINKPKITYKNYGKTLIAFIVGICIILAIALIIFFLDLNKEVQIASGTEIINTFKQDPLQILLFFSCALFAGFFMIIPGISGSMITYLFNQYWTINYLLTDSINNLFANLNIVFLVLFALTAIIGMSLSIFFSAWMIKKYRNEFYALSFGMVCSSFVAILLIAPKNIWTWTTNQNLHIGLICFAICVGILINLLFIFLYKKKHQITFNQLFLKTFDSFSKT